MMRTAPLTLEDFQSVVASMTSWEDEGEVEADEREQANATHRKSDGTAVGFFETGWSR